MLVRLFPAHYPATADGIAAPLPNGTRNHLPMLQLQVKRLPSKARYRMQGVAATCKHCSTLAAPAERRTCQPKAPALAMDAETLAAHSEARTTTGSLDADGSPATRHLGHCAEPRRA
ncbi:hypothetical protein Q31a_38650 [Aureliella helgolandensis]|uniref:Uncharacterized protein n=1 Tax=Aureliella helgolandensis TaxID=2527968 RepID=A0A518GAE7_9BACT|nr:hypothetical protein Q31a_38650 [Aureliella helgolandensis]